MKTEKQILSIIEAACTKEREAMKAGDAAAVERLDALTTLAADIVLTPEEMSAEWSEEQPEVDYNKFEKLFDEFCESNKGHHITSHDACMWFWELGLNARKEDMK